MRALPQVRVLDAVLIGLDDGRTARPLHRHHARALRSNPAERFQFREGLPHADQAGAAAGRVQDHIGHVPAELFGQFQPHGFLALDPVGLFQGVGFKPARLFAAINDDLTAIVDQAVDAVDPGPLQRDFTHVDFRRIGGTEHDAFNAGPRTIGRQRRARVAVGCHRHLADAQFLGHGHGHDQAPRLERTGGQAAFVLDDDFAATQLLLQFRQGDQRGHGLAQGDDVRRLAHRQQFPVTPQVGRARRQVVTRHRSLDARQVVTHQKRLARRRQVGKLVGGQLFTGHAAFEIGDECRPFGGQVILHPAPGYLTTGVLISPTPSIWPSITSPATTAATPSGVPV